jgi:hypothetical protein
LATGQLDAASAASVDSESRRRDRTARR